MGKYSYVQFNEIVDGILRYHTHYDVGKIEYLNLCEHYNVIGKGEYD